MSDQTGTILQKKTNPKNPQKLLGLTFILKQDQTLVLVLSQFYLLPLIS